MRIEAIPAWVAGTNSYLAQTDSGEAFLVDAPPEPEAIGDHVARLDLAVVGILLTHGHVDHTGGAGELSAATGAVTYVHPDDEFLTMHPREQLRRIFGMIPPGSYELPDHMEDLRHGQILEFGDARLEVRHTPGHTPGHCCFYSDEQGVLFSGDQLFAGSVGRFDLPGGDGSLLFRSMREQVMTLEDDVRVLPGHGPETTIGVERRTNPFAAQWRSHASG